MIGLDGFPLPPPPDGAPPPFPLGLFLALAIGFGLLFAFVWFLVVQREITREQTKGVLRARIEHERAMRIECLIEQSPGGRKPWQDRRGG